MYWQCRHDKPNPLSVCILRQYLHPFHFSSKSWYCVSHVSWLRCLRGHILHSTTSGVVETAKQWRRRKTAVQALYDEEKIFQIAAQETALWQTSHTLWRPEQNKTIMDEGTVQHLGLCNHVKGVSNPTSVGTGQQFGSSTPSPPEGKSKWLSRSMWCYESSLLRATAVKAHTTTHIRTYKQPKHNATSMQPASTQHSCSDTQ